MSVHGVKKIKAAIQAAKVAGSSGIEKGLKMAGLFLQRESMKIVPIDLGVLRNSAQTRAEGRGADTQVFVSYGTDYAVFVHEDLQARHKPGKSAKFLEKPFRQHRNKLREIIEKAISDEMGGVLA